MPELRLVQVDAFADRPFTGNPAAVVPLETWLPDETLQAIAEENNLSETAFTVPATDGGADYELRWFTPTVEIALCGHATLASGHVLLGDGDRLRFRTRQAGILTVSRDGAGYRLDLPQTRVRRATEQQAATSSPATALASSTSSPMTAPATRPARAPPQLRRLGGHRHPAVRGRSGVGNPAPRHEAAWGDRLYGDRHRARIGRT
jgi:predicted PhzF superfamily epimerase YddE/YHI9